MFFSKKWKKLNPRKTSQSNDILTKLIKEFSDIFATNIAKGFYKWLNNGNFLKSFKISEEISMQLFEEISM